MRHTIVVILILAAAGYVRGQKIFIPHQAFVSTEGAEEWMPVVAKQMITWLSAHRPANRANYYAYVFRFHLIACERKKALGFIDSLRAEMPDEVGRTTGVFPFFVYLLADPGAGQAQFADNFDGVFSHEYEKLSPAAAESAESYFNADLDARQQGYLDLAQRSGNSGKDSITFDDARALCFAWANYKVYGAEHALARQSLSTILRKRFFVEDSVMIPLPDGTRISATVVRSRSVQIPQPVVLKFGIYADASEIGAAKAIAARGFAGVIADVRGKRLGPGPVVPFEHDAADVYAIIDWISRQSWCNGKVGMYGGSYLGFTTWAATKNRHPALKAIVPMAAVAPGRDFPAFHGIMWTEMLQWFHLVGDNALLSVAERNAAHWDSAYANLYTSRQPIQALDAIEGRRNDLFQKFSSHKRFDSFWKNMIPSDEDFKKLDIPVLTVTGFYDDDQRGAFYYYREHLRHNPLARHWLLIGPWDHGTSQEGKTTRVLNYKLDDVASVDLTNLVFEWFNYVLKDEPLPAILKDKVNVEVMGANEWRNAPAVERINGAAMRWYLTGKPTPGGTGFSMTPMQVDLSGGQKIEVSADLSDRQISSVNHQAAVNGEKSVELDSLSGGSFISFFSERFADNTDLIGSPEVHLNMIVDQPDADVCLNVYEQRSDGTFFQLSNTLFRLSHVRNNEQPKLLKPGRKESFTFTDTFFTSKRISRGSRLVFSFGINKNIRWETNGTKPVTIRLVGSNWIQFK